MKRIGQSDRPHAAYECVADGHHGDEHDTHSHVQAEEQIEHPREGDELSGDPAKIARHHHRGGNDLRTFVELTAKKIAHREEFHLPERSCEEQRGDDETEAGAEGLERGALQSFAANFVRSGENRPGAEPCTQKRRCREREAQPPTGDDEVLAALDAPAHAKRECVEAHDVSDERDAEKPPEDGVEIHVVSASLLWRLAMCSIIASDSGLPMRPPVSIATALTGRATRMGESPTLRIAKCPKP